MAENDDMSELHHNLLIQDRVTTYARESYAGRPAGWVRTEWHWLEVRGGPTSRWWRGRPRRCRRDLPWSNTALRDLLVFDGWGHPEPPVVKQPDPSTFFAALADGDALAALVSEYDARGDLALRRMLLVHFTAGARILRDYRGAVRRPESVFDVPAEFAPTTMGEELG